MSEPIGAQMLVKPNLKFKLSKCTNVSVALFFFHQGDEIKLGGQVKSKHAKNGHFMTVYE